MALFMSIGSYSRTGSVNTGGQAISTVKADSLKTNFSYNKSIAPKVFYHSILKYVSKTDKFKVEIEGVTTGSIVSEAYKTKAIIIRSKINKITPRSVAPYTTSMNDIASRCGVCVNDGEHDSDGFVHYYSCGADVYDPNTNTWSIDCSASSCPGKCLPQNA